MALSHPESNHITEEVIGAAIRVHQELGPGLLESVFEECLYLELLERQLDVDRQRVVPIVYRSKEIPCALKADLIVGNAVVVEVKSVERVLPVHKSQVLTYMTLARLRVGLLINFNVPRLIDGITRLSL
jgi:GxxExxY protein